MRPERSGPWHLKQVSDMMGRISRLKLTGSCAAAPRHKDRKNRVRTSPSIYRIEYAVAMRNTGKVALVTGAGSGIGRAVALGLLRAGYAVALAGRRVGPLEETARAAHAHERAPSVPSPRALVVPSDVTDPQAVAELFARTVAAFGRLDVLFNNAGISGPAVPLEDLAVETWLAVVATNLTGPFLCKIGRAHV